MVLLDISCDRNIYISKKKKIRRYFSSKRHFIQHQDLIPSWFNSHRRCCVKWGVNQRRVKRIPPVSPNNGRCFARVHYYFRTEYICWNEYLIDFERTGGERCYIMPLYFYGLHNECPGTHSKL